MRKAVYAGSFDPITNGHLWMIESGLRLFDELVVAIAINPEKTYTFTFVERMEMLRESTLPFPQISIDRVNNRFLVHYANDIHAQYILRGIRSEGDYEYERKMRHINNDLQPDIVTVFLMPPRAIAEVSSSTVKGLIGLQGWEAVVKNYVPEPVHKLLLKKFLDHDN